jgi:ATP-binding cassette subfamily B protein
MRLKANKAEDREKATISDVFTNIDSIKYFGKEGRVKSLFTKLSSDARNKFLQTWNYYRLIGTGQSLILSVGIFLILYFPFVKFLKGNLTIGTLVFIYTIYFNLAGPLFSFVHGVRQYYDALADLHALTGYENERNEIEDKAHTKDLEINEGKINFDNVNFKYHDRRIIKNLSLDINSGEKVALVGYSGSGKTTLIKLLYRLYDVSSGRILVDGKDIRDVRQESLRSSLSIVPQEAILFDDTIYNNILFSNPKAERAEVLKAIRFAQLDKLIRNLPKGEKTIVGERGVKLSGGEKQRVSIARALLADKKILILDEATSALDSQTEHEIQKDLWRLMQGRTSIIIAHRLSTVMHADKIVVMDKGRIVQMGRHRDLIAKKGRYKELWDLQKGGFLEE